jgi:hypothetical protein
MNQAPRVTRKGPNRKSASKNTNGEASQQGLHTKENPVNPVTTTVTPMLSRRQPFEEVTIEANNVKDMAQKMLEMQGEFATWCDKG